MSEALQTNEAAAYLGKLHQGFSNLTELTDDDVQIAQTPKELVARNDKTSLYRYKPRVPREIETPLLIVYSQIGRYTMVDLQPDRSIVGNLLDAGIEVYLVDWGLPNRSDRWLRFEDYIYEYMGGYVDEICHRHRCSQVSLLGICEGGVFTTCYAATTARVRNLALAVTPIDFHADEDDLVLEQGYLNRWVRNLSSEELSDLIDSYGQMPGSVTGMLFQEMTPMKSMTKYNWDLADSLSGSKDEVVNFLRMEKWLSDRPNHPGEAAKQWLIELYKENRLVKGEFMLDGEVVDLRKLDMPVLNIYSSNDHIVPPPTSQALKRFAGSTDYSELELGVGHIGTFVSRKANRQFTDTLIDWLAKRDPSKD